MEGSKDGKSQIRQLVFTAIHFNHVLSELSTRSKRKWIFAFPIRGLSSRNPVKRKEGTFEGKADRIKSMQMSKVRGHKWVTLGAQKAPFCMVCRFFSFKLN